MLLAFAIAQDWRSSISEGETLNGYHKHIQVFAKRHLPMLPGVVWLGDSTMISKAGNMSFPIRVQKRLRMPAEHRSLILPAYDFYHYYFLIHRVMETKTDLIIVPLNLRMFGSNTIEARNDLASYLPLSELPTAATLSLYERGITLPGLFMLQLLNVPAIERGFFFFSGLRKRFYDADFWEPVMGKIPTRLSDMERYGLGRYDVEVWEGGPMLDVMGATVAAAVRGGAQILVFVSPIPWQELAKRNLYERSRYERRLEIARRTIEKNGGHFWDLHRLLRKDDFRDIFGHYESSGNEKVTVALLPAIRSLVGLAAQSRARRGDHE